jgi:hypothetical protein
MEILLIIGGIWLFVAIVGKANRQKPPNRDNSRPYTPSATSQSKQNTQTFRPTSNNRSTSNISFKVASTTSGFGTGNVPTESDLEGLHDAFTGAPLDKSLGLHQCQSCKVYYHTDSLLVLREANNSQCVACPSKNILAVISASKSSGGRDYTPNVVTLQNYKQHEGSVVTFEGRVHKVHESRRGNDFAVMFEDKSWVSGFKLVFFSGAVLKVGGPKFINSLLGKNVRVRGLVIKHPKFGYEIIVSEKSMIMSVES